MRIDRGRDGSFVLYLFKHLPNIDFLFTYFFREPRRKEVGGKEATSIMISQDNIKIRDFYENIYQIF